jgi:hypothetical protein
VNAVVVLYGLVDTYNPELDIITLLHRKEIL